LKGGTAKKFFSPQRAPHPASQAKCGSNSLASIHRKNSANADESARPMRREISEAPSTPAHTGDKIIRFHPLRAPSAFRQSASARRIHHTL
jgi:hypothetical protein